MTLNTLLQSAGMAKVLADPEISGLSYDSRTTAPGDLFFALPGEKVDGGKFCRDAVARGAAAIVAAGQPNEIDSPVVLVENPRAAMGALAAAFYRHPANDLKCVGVTGTNGKTTTAFLVQHLLESAGQSCGLIGTIKYVVAGRELPASRTTPESVDLQSMLEQIREAHGRAVAMEVSSHALVQNRVDGISFDAAVFTNLTQDHLDFHHSMDAYFEAKALLFEKLSHAPGRKGTAIVNADDRYGHRLIERFEKRLKLVTFGRGVNAAFRASAIRFEGGMTTFQLDARRKSYLVRLPLIGLFNVYNALGALAAATACGVELRASVAALANAPQVPGRLERVPSKRNFHVYVDYAHTDDALRNVLRTLRELNPERIITVFGCGGDRDRAKRPLMGAASAELSDLSIITSDNPRGEDPVAIIRDIEAGMSGRPFEIIEDREEAIRHAIEIAQPGDIVLIAGKGHEKTQEFRDRKIAFDDVTVAGRAISSKRVENLV